MPQASQAGWVKAGSAAPRPAGVTATAAMSIAAPSWSIPPKTSLTLVFATRWPSMT
jgi:hypothetical protein